MPTFTVKKAERKLVPGGDPTKSFVSYELSLEFPSKQDYKDLRRFIATNSTGVETNPLRGPRPSLSGVNESGKPLTATLGYFETLRCWHNPSRFDRSVSRAMQGEILKRLKLHFNPDADTVEVPAVHTTAARRLSPLSTSPGSAPCTAPPSEHSSPPSPTSLAPGVPVPWPTLAPLLSAAATRHFLQPGARPDPSEIGARLDQRKALPFDPT